MKRWLFIGIALSVTGWSCTTVPAVVQVPNSVVELSAVDPVVNNVRNSVIYSEVIDGSFTLVELALETGKRTPLFNLESEPLQLLVSVDGSYIVERDAEALRFYRFSDHAVERLYEAGVLQVELSASGRQITYTVETEDQETRTLQRAVSASAEVGEASELTTNTNRNVNL